MTLPSHRYNGPAAPRALALHHLGATEVVFARDPTKGRGWEIGDQLTGFAIPPAGFPFGSIGPSVSTRPPPPATGARPSHVRPCRGRHGSLSLAAYILVQPQPVGHASRRSGRLALRPPHGGKASDGGLWVRGCAWKQSRTAGSPCTSTAADQQLSLLSLRADANATWGYQEAEPHGAGNAQYTQGAGLI